MGSHYAAGQTTEDSVVNAVWAYFQGLAITQQDEVSHVGNVSLPGFAKPISYWKYYTNLVNPNKSPAPFNGSCSCGAVAALLVDVFYSQGIDHEEPIIEYNSSESSIIVVKNWVPQGPQINSNHGLVDVILYDYVGEQQASEYPTFNSEGIGYNIHED